MAVTNRTFILVCSLFVIYVALLVSAQFKVPGVLNPNGVGPGVQHCASCGEFTNTNKTVREISRCALHLRKVPVNDSDFRCECREPLYFGNGYDCVDFDECKNATDNCDNNANCINEVGGFSCNCKTGWEGTGIDCTDVKECDETDAAAKYCNGTAGNCVNTVGSYTCTCNNGYKIKAATDNTECIDINECDVGTHDCEGQSHCVNDVGSFHCECNTGYNEGPARPASKQGFNCKDINECKDKPKACGQNTKCSNGEGSYTCQCQNEYYKWANASNQFGNCIDINECKEAPIHDCTGFPNTVCNNTVGGVDCICAPGWSGDKDTCSDVNECTEGTHLCDKNANCTDTPGNYACTCNSGYKGDGYTCGNIDECAEIKPYPCDENAYCVDGVGSYKCTCIYGFSGDGKTCKDTGKELPEKAKQLENAQAVIQVHLLDNERNQLENRHEVLLRRCAKQDQEKQRPKRAIVGVTNEQALDAEAWIVALQKNIADLKLANHALELACPE